MRKLHPHSAAMLKAFVPLLEAQNALAEALRAPVLPDLDRAAFAQGKAWMPAVSAEASLYFDRAFLKAAPKKLVSAAARGLPELKERLKSLGGCLAAHPEEAANLALLHVRGTPRKLGAWAKKHEQDANAVSLLALHLAAAAARRLEREARKLVLPPWNKGHCPICGCRPHGGFLRGKEGKRWLQCSLCRHEWMFSRTSCPVCAQDDTRNILVFFTEDMKYERAEACKLCRHYLLSVDMRELTGDAPFELYLLCMLPLDQLMQEDGYIPAVNAGKA
jgi:FdhE protein